MRYITALCTLWCRYKIGVLKWPLSECYEIVYSASAVLLHMCVLQVEMFYMWMCTCPLGSCIGATLAALSPLRMVFAG